MTDRPTTVVYLSPHHDDVCFSLGWTALSGPGGHLVTLFSRSNYTAGSRCLRRRAGGLLRLLCRSGALVGHVSRLRAAEDRRFAERCRLVRHDLGLTDALLAGKPVWSAEAIEPEARRLGARLGHFLPSLVEPAGTGVLFVPMAIGGHRDHVVTAQAVLYAYPVLHPHFRILFYEDLHYASDRQARAEGLERFRRLAGFRELRRHVVDMEAAQFRAKLDLVALYASQHRRPPAPDAYTPADDERPHEAYWEFTGPG